MIIKCYKKVKLTLEEQKKIFQINEGLFPGGVEINNHYIWFGFGGYLFISIDRETDEINGSIDWQFYEYLKITKEQKTEIIKARDLNKERFTKIKENTP
jgi:hypothetical protein